MSKKRGYLCVVLLLIGFLFILNSQANITGAYIGISPSSELNSIIGILFILTSIILFAEGDEEEEPEEKLEKRLKIYETNIGNRHVVEVSGLSEITNWFIQADKNPPVFRDEGERRIGARINLSTVDELLDAIATPEERKRLADEYRNSIKEKIMGGLTDYYRFKIKNRLAKEELDKLPDEKRDAYEELRKKVYRDLRIAKGAERLLKVLDPDYKTRSERIKEITAAHSGAPQVFRPINRGKAAYVHYTNGWGLDRLEEEGTSSDTDTLFFPSLEEARKFAATVSRRDAEKITGASHTEKVVVFQTPMVPDIIPLTGKSGKYHAIFREGFKKDDCYTWEEGNTPRKKTPGRS